MIPRVIHYCWFGHNSLPELAIRCIASWKKYCPDYEIKEWNENNFDVTCCPYVSEAYEKKKWAFVSDYARFWILYHYGGLYFDTDVELIRAIDDLVERGAFMGVEKEFDSELFLPLHYNKNDSNVSSSGYNITNDIKYACNVALNANSVSINPGLGLAAAPGLGLYKEILNYYQNEHFIKNGHMDVTTVVKRVSAILLRHDIIAVNENMLYVSNDALDTKKDDQYGGIYIYQKDFFCPVNHEIYDYHDFQQSVLKPKKNKISSCIYEITNNTRSIHHYAGSWSTMASKIVKTIDIIFIKNKKDICVGNVVQNRTLLNKILVAPFIFINKCQEMGYIETLKYTMKKLRSRISASMSEKNLL